jgi:hypothetical protein
VVRVNVPSKNLQVFQDDAPLDTDIICVTVDQCTLYFKAAIPQSSYAVFSLKEMDGDVNLVKGEAKTITELVDEVKVNDTISVVRYFDKFMLKNKEARKSFNLSYHYYESYQGDG